MAMFWQRYGRSILQVLAAGVAIAVAAFTGDGRIDPSEWNNVLFAVVTAAAVFTAPNIPGAGYIKVTLAVLGAVSVAAASYIADGISWTDAGQLLVAALAALGVKFAPSISSSVLRFDKPVSEAQFAEFQQRWRDEEAKADRPFPSGEAR